MNKFKKGDLVAFYKIEHGKEVGLNLSQLYRVAYCSNEYDEDSKSKLYLLIENEHYIDYDYQDIEAPFWWWDYSIWTNEIAIDFVKNCCVQLSLF